MGSDEVFAVTAEPEATTHGDAWRCFCKHMEGRQYGAEETRDTWLAFLAGWLSKAEQHIPAPPPALPMRHIKEGVRIYTPEENTALEKANRE